MDEQFNFKKQYRNILLIVLVAGLLVSIDSHLYIKAWRFTDLGKYIA